MELAGALTVVAALVIVAAALVFAARGVISRPVVIGAVATLVVTAVVGGIAGGPSGLRRFTPVLPVFYCLFAFVAQQALAGDARRWVRWALVAALAIVPLHHLAVFPRTAVSSAPGNRYAMWGRSPLAAVDGLLKTAVADGVVIQCTNAAGKRQLCRYAETFATVAGACRWNSLPCRETMAFDLKTEKVIPVSISLSETYYWQH